jgi:glycosyltransferase involved in cell wall biosynthesis
VRILVSAFSCAPNVGSEAGVGWKWATELAKIHDVVVVTDVTRRSQIENATSSSGGSMRFVYYRPRWLRWVPLNSITAQVLYGLWQLCLLRFARALHRDERFDLCIHLTYGVFRQPSFLGYLGIPFIFGPLGGGEDAPLRLKRSLDWREWSKELLRAALNRWAMVDPILRCAYRRASMVVVRTDETRAALPRAFRSRAVVFQEIGVDVRPHLVPVLRSASEPLHVLFVGRLLGWKGVHLAIRAVSAAIRAGANIAFTIVGDGPCAGRLRRLAAEEGIGDRIKWINGLPQQELFSLYEASHCFLFPSLHDSGGNVVLEAQASCLPVICLDLGGPPTLVSETGSIVIGTSEKSEQDVVNSLSLALLELWADEGMRMAMASNARRHVATRSWGSRVNGLLALAAEFGVLGDGGAR